MTARAILFAVSRPPTCPLCAYVPVGTTSREMLIDLFKHQQAVHVDPLKRVTDAETGISMRLVDKFDPSRAL